MRALPLLLLAGCLNTRDVAFESVFAATLAVDAVQTVRITAACREDNPVLGRCGDGVPVGAYFPLMLAAHIAVVALLPEVLRGPVEGFSIGLEATTAWRNWRDGVNARY